MRFSGLTGYNSTSLTGYNSTNEDAAKAENPEPGCDERGTNHG